MSFIARTSGYANRKRLGMVGPSLYAPHSRGSVRLDPKNPNGEPLVDLDFLAVPAMPSASCRPLVSPAR